MTVTYRGRLTGLGVAARAGMDSVPLAFGGEEESGKTFVIFLSVFDTVWLLAPDRATVEAALAAWATTEVEARIRAGEHESLTGDEAINLTLPSERADEVKRLLQPQADKHCRWQGKKAAGLVCEATAPDYEEATTRALCGACAIPDERWICSELVHPRIAWIETLAAVNRTPKRVLCGAGENPGNGANCKPGGLSCWRRYVRADEELPDVPRDLPRLAAEELDYFRLVVRDRYADVGRVLSIPEARSVAEFFGKCTSAADFQRRVAALADLLAQIDVYGALTEEQRRDSQGNRVGNLVALERLMARDYPEAEQSVKLLRLVPRARNSFPIHSRSQGLLDALRGLGVDFPTEDWAVAWNQVLRSFWTAVASIRRSVQASKPRGDAEAE